MCKAIVYIHFMILVHTLKICEQGFAYGNAYPFCWLGQDVASIASGTLAEEVDPVLDIDLNSMNVFWPYFHHLHLCTANSVTYMYHSYSLLLRTTVTTESGLDNIIARFPGEDTWNLFSNYLKEWLIHSGLICRQGPVSQYYFFFFITSAWVFIDVNLLGTYIK